MENLEEHPSPSEAEKTIFGYVADCKEDTEAATSMHSYENGKVVSSYTVPSDTKLEFKAYPPGTMGASEVALVCRMARNNWIPLPTLNTGMEAWRDVGSGYFIDMKSIGTTNGVTRYWIKTGSDENGYKKFAVVARCKRGESAIAQALMFDADEKFDPRFSLNFEAENPNLNFVNNPPGLDSAKLAKIACSHTGRS